MLERLGNIPVYFVKIFEAICVDNQAKQCKECSFRPNWFAYSFGVSLGFGGAMGQKLIGVCQGG